MDSMPPSTSFGAPPSGLPPIAWLSGLSLNTPGLSGADGTMSGATQGQGGMGGRMPGGLSLAELSEMLAAMGGEGGGEVSGPGTTQSVLTGLGATSLGQGGGSGYGMSGGTTTPGSGAGYQTAGATQGVDPLQIIRQALGLVGTGAKVAGLGSQPGSSGYSSQGTSATDQLINPTGYSLTGSELGSTPSTDLFGPGALTGTNLFDDPTLGPLLTQGLLTGSLQPNDLANIGTLGPDQLAGLRTALFEGGVQSDLGSQLLSGQGGTGGYSLGGNTNLDLSGGGLPDTNWGGAFQGGLGSTLGLLNIIQAAQGGNVPQGVGGGLQTIGGLTNLLQNSPALAESLGLSSAALGTAGGVAGGLGGLFGLATGIKGLVEGTASPGQAAAQLGSGALGTYSALQTLSALYPSLFGGTLPSLTSATASLISAVAPELAASLGIGAGAGAAGGAAAGAAGAGAAGAGAGAGGAGAAGGSAAAGAGGALAGLGGAVTAVLAPFAFAALMQGFGGEGGDMFSGGTAKTDYEGKSKYVSLKRQAASQAYDTTSNYANSLVQNAEQILGQPGVTPDTLRQVGDSLMGGWLTYFQNQRGIGPSSHTVEGDQSQNAWNRALTDWRAINQALIAAGQPGLDIPAGAVSVSGILPSVLPTPDAQGVDWQAVTASENQPKLNQAFMDYTKGIPANPAILAMLRGLPTPAPAPLALPAQATQMRPAPLPIPASFVGGGFDPQSQINALAAAYGLA